MAILTLVDFANAKRDISDIGKSVNEDTIVQPRWGGAYDSLPRISRLWLERFDLLATNAESMIQDWQNAINLITVEGGIPALAVSDKSGATQQEINDLGGVRYWTEESSGYQVNYEVRLDNGDVVKSTIPNNTTNPNEDMTGWDYTTKRQDFKKKSIFDYMTSLELNQFYVAPPRTFDFSGILNRAIASLNPVGAKGAKQAIHLPAIKGGYMIKSPIWCVKHTALIGESGGLWQYEPTANNIHSDIYADFENPYQFVINSDTRVLSTDTRIPYDSLVTGGAMDGMQYSWSDGIHLSGFRIYTKSRVFGGIKLVGAVNSYIDPSVVVTGCDYGYVASACWNSIHTGKSLSYKCGYLGYDAMNGCVIDGYHNNSGAPTLLNTNLLNFFSAGYDLPIATLNNNLTNFGVVIKKSYGVTGNIVSEGVDFSLVTDDRVQAFFSCVYAEKIRHVAILAGNQCQIDIGSATGGLVDGAAYHAGTNSRIKINNYGMIANKTHLYSLMASSGSSVISLPSRFFPEFASNIIWNDKNDNIVYLSASGSDTASGANYVYPTNFTQAVERISSEPEKPDRTLTLPSNKNVVFYLITAGEYTLNKPYLSLYGKVSIRRKSTLTTSNTILNMSNFVYLASCDLDITSVTVKIPNKTYDFLTWARNAPIINNGGINSLCLNSSDVIFEGTSNGIVSYTSNSDSLFNFNIRRGSISGVGDIVQRPEVVTVGGITNLNIGESCVVDNNIKSKSNFGINISKDSQGLIVLPWKARLASATYNPPTIPANQSITTTLALIGARLGDFVEASFTIYNENIEISANVSAVDVVTVKFKNTSDSAIDLENGTLAVKNT